MKAVWSPTAMRHLAEIRRYSARDDPRAATAAAAAIRKAVVGLRSFPGLGRPGGMPHTRELTIPRTPYVVPCSVRGDIIEIHAVLHGAKSWPERFDT